MEMNSEWQKKEAPALAGASSKLLKKDGMIYFINVILFVMRVLPERSSYR